MLHRRRWSLCAGLAAVLLLLVGLTGPAGAQIVAAPAPSANDAFAVSGIQVDISAANANAARDQAITQAQRKAWDTLYQRMVPGGGAAPRLSDFDLSRLVQGFEIDNEKVSATRYIGTFTVRFRPQPVREQLAGAGAGSYVEPPTRPLVVLPITVTEGRTILWEDSTPWRDAWEEREPGSSLVPLVVPDGELEDIQAITAADALAGNPEALTRIAQRHRAGGVVVARTELPPGGPDPKAPLTVGVTRLGLDGARDQQTVTVRPDPDDRVPDLMRRAVSFTGATLDEMWKRENTVSSGPEQTFTVSMPLTRIEDWVEARRRLSGVNGVTRADILSLSRSEAIVALTVRGDVQRLQQALARRDLALSAASPPPLMSGQPMLPARPAYELRLAGRGAELQPLPPVGGTGIAPPSASMPSVAPPSAGMPGVAPSISGTPLPAPSYGTPRATAPLPEGSTAPIGTLGTLRPGTPRY
ncbi:MAG TPA: DUF2066 domain-containing protein [Azospirillum sp.]|nr:DUF2066 domain-containing protein [Azospirillum sp.]